MKTMREHVRSLIYVLLKCARLKGPRTNCIDFNRLRVNLSDYIYIFKKIFNFFFFWGGDVEGGRYTNE